MSNTSVFVEMAQIIAICFAQAGKMKKLMINNLFSISVGKYQQITKQESQ